MKGDKKRALADFSEAIRLDPKCAPAYCCRSRVYSALGDHDRALADASQAVRVGPAKAEYRLARGEEYASQGKRDQALRRFPRGSAWIRCQHLHPSR